MPPQNLYTTHMKSADDLPVMAFETQRDWEAWLEEHHADTPGILTCYPKCDQALCETSACQTVWA
jgi:uncharacterized protein YdeI (YjbR/CyaY-like superfamily)